MYVALNASPVTSLYPPTSVHELGYRRSSLEPRAMESSVKPGPRSTIFSVKVGDVFPNRHLRFGQRRHDLFPASVKSVKILQFRRSAGRSKNICDFFSSVIGSVWPLRPDHFDQSATLASSEVAKFWRPTSVFKLGRPYFAISSLISSLSPS